jgi:hypothetical protein
LPDRSRIEHSAGDLAEALKERITNGREFASRVRGAAGATLPGVVDSLESEYEAWDNANERLLEVGFTKVSERDSYRRQRKTERLSYSPSDQERLNNLARRIDSKVAWFEGLVGSVHLYKVDGPEPQALPAKHSAVARVGFAAIPVGLLGGVLAALLTGAQSRLDSGRMAAVIFASSAGGLLGLGLALAFGRKSAWGAFSVGLVGLASGLVVFCVVATGIELSIPGDGGTSVSPTLTPTSPPTSTPIVQELTWDPQPPKDYAVQFRGTKKLLDGQLSVAVGTGPVSTSYPPALLVIAVAGAPAGCSASDVRPKDTGNLFIFVGTPGYTYFVEVTNVEAGDIRLVSGRYTGQPRSLGCESHHGFSLALVLSQIGKP